MTHEIKVEQWLRRSRVGSRDFEVEIGAFKTPIPGIRPFYIDRFTTYANESCLVDYWGDAAVLPFRDNSLDYVASSHVIEHTANPVAALLEWARVVRAGGILYLVVPDRRYTFDHTRELTSPEHMLEEFVRQTTFTDGIDIVERFPDQCPNGFLLVIRVRKTLRARMVSLLFRLRAGNKAETALLPDVKPMI